MEAYADQKARKYEESRSAAQRYLDFYPADNDAAYAQYLLALSYYDQIDAIGRDQGVTFQALQALRKVIEQYPDSEYARSAILKFDLAFDHLAAKEMEIGRYLPEARRLFGGDQPLPRGGRAISDHELYARGAGASGGSLSRTRADR